MVDDEDEDDSDLYTEENIRRFHEAKADCAAGRQGIPMEEVLADFGWNLDDFPPRT